LSRRLFFALTTSLLNRKDTKSAKKEGFTLPLMRLSLYDSKSNINEKKRNSLFAKVSVANVGKKTVN
jgi:hypothetical protein